MTRLHKIGLSVLAVFALASCAQSEDSGSVKGYLLNHGFSESNITLMSGEAYKKTQSESFVAEGLKEYLAGVKAGASEKEPGEQFYCWFFDNIDQADKFVKDYVGDMYHSLEGRCKDPAMGSRNNVAWAGTSGIAVGLGWSSAA